eukprot:m.1380180 g.1380180  ORF g.1380180 m.1380180 type:complete len:313 (-) comp24968_c0_seq45:607-1545(-)
MMNACMPTHVVRGCSGWGRNHETGTTKVRAAIPTCTATSDSGTALRELTLVFVRERVDHSIQDAFDCARTFHMSQHRVRCTVYGKDYLALRLNPSQTEGGTHTCTSSTRTRCSLMDVSHIDLFVCNRVGTGLGQYTVHAAPCNCFRTNTTIVSDSALLHNNQRQPHYTRAKDLQSSPHVSPGKERRRRHTGQHPSVQPQHTYSWGYSTHATAMDCTYKAMLLLLRDRLCVDVLFELGWGQNTVSIHIKLVEIREDQVAQVIIYFAKRHEHGTQPLVLGDLVVQSCGTQLFHEIRRYIFRLHHLRGGARRPIE